METFRNWQFNLRQLELFLAVAEAGSIRSAARRSGLTQPAVTHAMKLLEETVGAALFERGTRGSPLTEIGEALRRHGHLVFNELRRAQSEISQLRDGTGGRLAVAFSSAAFSLLPRAMKAFRQQCPGVALELQEFSGPQHDELWLGGHYDFAVVSEWVEGDDAFQREWLRDVPLIVMARAGHPCGASTSLAELKGCTWIYPDYARQLMAHLFQEIGLSPPADYIACRSIRLALTLLEDADALCMVSGESERLLQRQYNIQRVPVGDGPLARLRLSLLARDMKAMSPTAQKFAECIRDASRAARH